MSGARVIQAPRIVAPRWWVFVLAACAAAVAALRLSGFASTAAVETAVIIFIAIVVEALPFVLLGAAVAAAIEIFVPETAWMRLTRLPVALQMPAAAVGGFVFPVCECGSVPVARKLIHRGMHPAAGIAFMLASPIFNPIVLASTWIAYQARGVGMQMVAARAGLGLVLALTAGWVLSDRRVGAVLRSRPEETTGNLDVARPASRRAAFIAHLTNDFFFMGKFLVLGAALSALIQTSLPQSVLSGIAGTPVVGSIALMGIAFVSSLCSEADAFVAVSFAQFGLGSQLAFLVFGPVLDLKLSFLYGATFRRKFVWRLAAVALPITLAGSLWFEAIMR